MPDADVIIVGAGLAGLVAACELAEAGKRVIVLDQESRLNLGGQAFWSLGGLFLVNSSRAAPARHPRFARACRAGLVRVGRLRSRRRSLAAALGRGLSRFRRRREARLAARHGASHLSGGGLGRAGRRQCARARQFGAALPRHLGHRAGRARALPAAGAGGRASRPARLRLPPSRRRAHCQRWRDHRRAGRPAGTERGSARDREFADDGGRFRDAGWAVIIASGGIGGNIDLVRRNWPARLGNPPEL